MAESPSNRNAEQLLPELEGLTQGALKGYQILARKRGINTYEFETKPISAIGDNSFGMVLEVKLIPTTMLPGYEELAPIFTSVIKMAPKNLLRRKFTRVVEFYMREIFIYRQVLPVFAEVERKHIKCNKERFDQPPKILYFSLEQLDEFIIFEDLRLKNYAQNSRFKMPNYNLVEKAMISLARWHSMSFVIQHQQPERFKEWVSSMKDNLFSDLKPYSLEFGKRHVGRTRELIHKEKAKQNTLKQEKEQELTLFREQQDLPHLENGYSKSSRDRRNSSACRTLCNILDVVYTDFDKICVRCVDGIRDKPYSVICHGDFWNNNIMYHMDCEGNATSAKLIDFQMSRYGVPVLDVVHYLFSCTEKELRDEYYYEFLEVYYKSLGRHLKHFGLRVEKIYPRDIFQNQLNLYGIYGFCMASFCVPFFISNASETLDLTKLSEWAADISDNLPDSFTKLTDPSDESKHSVSANEILAAPETRSQELHNDANVSVQNNNLTKVVENSAEFEVLNERTYPIFKKRMIGVAVDLVNYHLAKMVECIQDNKAI